jgi:hypothetical protein
LSQLTPAMFIQDIETVGVPDLDHLSEVNITNHFFKYQQWQRKDLWNMFRSTWVFQFNNRGGRTSRKRSRWFSPSLMQKTKIGWTGQRRTRCSHLPCRWQWQQGKVRTAIWEVTRPVQRVYPLQMSLDNPILLCHEESKPQVTVDVDLQQTATHKSLTMV